jgi:hypothetical protein
LLLSVSTRLSSSHTSALSGRLPTESEGSSCGATSKPARLGRTSTHENDIPPVLEKDTDALPDLILQADEDPSDTSLPSRDEEDIRLQH